MQNNFNVNKPINKDEVKAFVQKTINNPTEAFEKLDKNAEKLRYCHQLLKDNKIIDDKGVSSSKNATFAIEARNLANILYTKDRNFVQALEQYNKSLCLSPLDSENIGICYANRSAIYFESGFYELALENIALAESHNYPKKLIPKLEARRSKCLELAGKNKEKKFEKPLKLSYPCNARIPSIIDGIEYGKTKDFGRFIKAKQDLYPGDIIIIDKPYIKCLVGSEYSKCNNCHQTNFLNLFPCQYCTMSMYCGPTCEQEAWKRFHQFECLTVEKDLNRLIIRAALMTFTLFDNLEELRGLIESLQKNPISGFDLTQKNLTEKETFKAIFCLETHASQRSSKDIFTRSNLLAQSWHLLITHSTLKNLLQTTDDEDLFLDTLLHFSQITATNSHELLFMSKTPEAKVEDDGIYSPKKFGSGLFPFISLLNHSCAPNVCRINSDGTIAIMVLRNIKAGEQLFDNYGCDHLHYTLDERKAKLAYYLFKCQCKACEGDYPLICELKKMKGIHFHHIRMGLKKVWDYDPEWAVEYFNICKNFVKEFDRFYPSAEVCTAKSIMTTASKILFENTPLELQIQPITKKN